MLFAALLLAAAAPGCPPTLHGSPLVGGDVFDGPPEELAQLKPDEGGRGVAVWPDLRYVSEAGRTLFLVCAYRDGGELRVAVDGAVSSCVQRDGARATSLICRRPAPRRTAAAR